VHDLNDLGWTEILEKAFEPYRSAGLAPARVALEHNHVYRVLTTEGESLAETAGRIKHRAAGRHELPVVGDWVALRPDPAHGRGVIRAVLPRRSAFSRKVAGRETAEQVVAANIDTVLVVFGLDRPVNARAIERYLVLARRSRTDPVIVLNKIDLVADLAAAVGEATAAAGDAQVIPISTREGHDVDAILALLARGRTLALLGPSGAGKSSIVNRLVGRELLPTGDVRDWDVRGRHTSVHRQLVVLDSGGLIIDTPGMRELQLWDVDEAVQETFDDVASLAGACRFRDCRHEQEPGCAVKAGVETGTLDAARYEGYLKLQREHEAFERKQDERWHIEAKRQGKIAQKAYRSLQKERGNKP
jgi:ribosome biogenesis GTPase / thiamine phosphate phosphatase